jgi:hypothetical protein
MHVKCKSIVTIMWNILQELNFTSIKVLEQYLWCPTDYHQDNWLKFLSLAEFVYNNIIHSSTQQTLLYTNHDLHPKFDIQGVNKIMNPTTKDWVVCLANVCVATLALGSRPRQRGCKGAGQREAQESHQGLPGV